MVKTRMDLRKSLNLTILDQKRAWVQSYKNFVTRIATKKLNILN